MMFRPLNCIIFFVFIVPVAFFLTAENSSAQPLECPVSTTKVAPGAEGQEFQFNGVDQNGDHFTFFVTAGEISSGVSAQSSTITEVPVPGWRFGGIECEPGEG
ncbi:MAG: hypothetical protein ACREOP_15915 [Thermodesulfobacteriota bacterium]